MALDEMVLKSVVGESSLPTLRLYDWNPACLSLGYAQPVSDVLQEKLDQDGYDLVRRATGGRAILHIDELTYSVIGSQDEPRLKGGVLESYRVLSTALLEALHLLGIPAHSDETSKSDQESRRKNENPVCFEVPSNYEITVDGKKMVGSAQARRKGGVLQHGTFPLFGDISRIVYYLDFPGEATRMNAANRLKQRALTAQEAIGGAITWREAADAFESAFKDRLNLVLHHDALSSQEEHQVEALMEEKYANPEWTGRISI